MEEELDIVVTGFNVDAKVAEAGLVRLFGIDGADARRFLQELPTVAKRGASAQTAARYVEALESIGARVDAVPARREPTGRHLSQAPPSLPAPPSSMMQQLHRSMRVDRATEEAIDRFRESEGMGARPPSSRPGPPVAPDRIVSFGPDPMNPRIPQAPRLPSLDGMPNATILEGLPEWRTGTSVDPRDSGGYKSFPSNPSMDGERATTASIDPPWHRDLPLTEQPKATGTTRHSDVVPGPSSASIRAMRRVGEAERQRRANRARLLIGALIAVVAFVVAGMWWSARGSTEEALRRSAMQGEGIDAGALQTARDWLADPRHGVRGLPAAQVDGLLTALERAGAVRIEAMRIDDTVADALLIELPSSADERRTVLWQVARSQGRELRLDDDRGQRFVELSF